MITLTGTKNGRTVSVQTDDPAVATQLVRLNAAQGWDVLVSSTDDQPQDDDPSAPILWGSDR